MTPIPAKSICKPSLNIRGRDRSTGRRHLSRQRIPIIFGCILYFASLNWSYRAVDSVLYNGLGFTFVNQSPLVLGLAFAMAILPSLWLPSELTYPSQVCYWLIYLCIVVPTMFLPHFVLTSQNTWNILPLPTAILLCFMVLGYSYRFPPIRISKPHLDHTLVVGAIMFCALLLIVIVVFTSGFNWNLSIDDAYDRRLDARNAVGGGTIRSYAIATLSHSLGPLLIAIGYVHRNVFAFSVGVIAAVCIFALAGTKTDIATPVFLFALLLLAARFQKVFGVSIVVSASLLVIASVAQYLFFERSELSLYLVRRQIFIPGLLTCFYWDCFNTGEFVYFSDSFLRAFIPRQYDLSTARLIGERYFGNAEMNANANIWASAFANVGYTGMLGITMVLAFLLRLIDGMAKQGDFLVISLMSGMFGLTWTNGALQTSILSNGVFITLIVIYYLGSSDRSKYQLPNRVAERDMPSTMTSKSS